MVGYNEEYIKHIDEILKKLKESEETLEEPAPKSPQSDKDLEEKSSLKRSF